MDENKICKTCVNWRRGKGKFGLCVSVNMFGNRHKIWKRYPITSLVTWGIDNQESGFTTGARFGCIHWKKDE